MSPRPCRQRGVGLVGALFVVVVVALLAAFMVTIGTTQRQVSTLSLLGARAFFAAEAGMQRAVHSVLANDACLAIAPFTLGGAAADFEVEITCSASPAISEGSETYTVFALTATASMGAAGTGDFVSRTLQATITGAP